jgi:hypothetical protein
VVQQAQQTLGLLRTRFSGLAQRRIVWYGKRSVRVEEAGKRSREDVEAVDIWGVRPWGLQ